MKPDIISIVGITVFFVFFVLILIKLALIYKKNPPACCQTRTYATEHYPADIHYHRQSLMDITYNEPSAAIQGVTAPQFPGGMFIIGNPSDYNMEGPQPQLPSYDGVHKEDRQRQIHSLISQRFGLNSCLSENPPTYEETFPQSFDTTPTDP